MTTFMLIGNKGSETKVEAEFSSALYLQRKIEELEKEKDYLQRLVAELLIKNQKLRECVS